MTGLDPLFFWLFASMTLVGAVLTVAMRGAVHCALGLIGSLIGVGGLFLLQGAEFLFAAQIILYVGGVMVLFVFVIMLVSLEREIRERQFSRSWPTAIGASAAAGALILWFLSHGANRFGLPVDLPAERPGNVEAVADLLFTEYLLPFEIASLLLLVAVVGSVVMAKKRLA